MRKLITFATGCLLLLALAACGGSGEISDGTNDPPQGPTASDSRTPTEQLAIMVLPLESYGDKYERFTVHNDSGYADSVEQAEETILLNDTAADVAARGFVSSYQLDYWDEKIITLRQTGVFAVSSEVGLFADSFAAASFMTKEVADTLAVVGQDIGDGVVMTEVTPFEVTELGDQAFGAHVTFVMPGLTFYGTVVWFRVGAHLASADMAATYKTGEAEAASVTEWARGVEDRIAAVLDGSLSAEPVELPTPAVTPVPETPVPVAP